ncbi:hypothetical protein HF521_019653 [Silurus meridionalis]|uniref:Uncharacterized protein n=1 Tax=Silurus meridionalis TaxID=175797 RepID=A0A8T0BH60_SILME|nr:hypothetical protein HF521_019653 [Silurus meridionalis]
MAKELEDISKERNKSSEEVQKRYKKDPEEDSVPDDMESSKSLVLLWAKELDRLDLSIEVTKKALVEAEVTQMKNKDVCYTQHSERLMKWAQELQTLTENLA